MKISVIIPAYNASSTIRQTLDAVLAQTVAPHEILVMDDGSTDDTAFAVGEYGSRVKLLQQENAGVAASRNALCRRADGDVIAFLDADDVWHPRYLEYQQRLLQEFPRSIAVFSGHRDFYDSDILEWDDSFENSTVVPEVWEMMPFLKFYNRHPGRFANLSHCCVPMRVMRNLGEEPFRMRIAEDIYFVNRLALLSPGPIAFMPLPLSAYRIRKGSISWDRAALNAGEVQAFELLSTEYQEKANGELFQIFKDAFNIKRRLYAKTLLVAGRRSDARRQLRAAISRPFLSTSTAKSSALFLASFLPRALQPNWPPAYRNVEGSGLAQKAT